jgi:hypothetical protein
VDYLQFDYPLTLTYYLFAFQGYTIKEYIKTNNHENPNHSSNDYMTIPSLIDFFDLQNQPSPINENNISKG